jgi:hypothetical protein
MEVEAGLDPSEVCVDALVRGALTRMDPETSCRLREKLNGRSPPTASGIMNRSVCRDVLLEMIELGTPELARMRFGFEFKWVEEALERLDARFPRFSLSAEEEEALLSI